MKKPYFLRAAVCLLTLTLLLAGCAAAPPQSTGSGAAAPPPPQDGEVAALDDGVTRIALLINGNLGDISFFDSANAGMQRFAQDFPEVEVKIVEMGTDNTKWEPTLRQTANEAWDLIIIGTTDMREPLQRLVKNSKYAERRFIIFDTEIEDDASANYPSVHSMLFKQNEGGFLAGALAALLTLEMGGERTGFIGGMKIDIINDFGYGFMQGVQRVNADWGGSVLAYNSYIGDFTNSPKGKSLADAMYGEGAAVLFAAASQAGLGCLDSAKNNGLYIIGVDSDQYAYFQELDPQKAQNIVSSVLKRVDTALYEACEAFVNGTLSYGTLAYMGVKEGKIGIVENERYRQVLSPEGQAYMAALREGILSGELTVDSGLKRFTPLETLNALYDTLDPNKQAA